MISVVATDTVDAIDGEKYILLAGNRHDCLRSRSKNKHENSLYRKRSRLKSDVLKRDTIKTESGLHGRTSVTGLLICFNGSVG